MKAVEIREKFLKFFEANGHQRVASSSLIPANDPTLLFANAGMNQFKDVFLGFDRRAYDTAASSQKCVRAGGKHNDLDNVGYTARHHTFFEMLGNFSFGAYFKERAIALAWRFLTEELQIPRERLYVTVFRDDDEAFAIWRDQVGVPAERIFRFGEKDNFWSMGDTGPCGPCSEIFYDYGDAVPGPADAFAAIESGSDRVTEVWNLVFMQFDRAADGTLTPLPNPSIDTGMGLERISSVVQGATSNYHTDLFQDIIQPVAAALGVSYGADAKTDAALRVIADHLRAMSFLIADGVNPSNEGRGYVLRRIMRRAMRYGKQLGQDEPFLYEMTRHVVAKMGDAYPELRAEQNQIEVYVRAEEQQFKSTLAKGLPILIKYLDKYQSEGLRNVPGPVVHFMYDTHGFPIDLMEDIARDWNMGLEKPVANHVAEAHKPSAVRIPEVLVADAQAYETQMTCYAGLTGEGTVRRLLAGEQALTRAEQGQDLIVILDSTPFYAESGGQIGDAGVIRTATGTFCVRETNKVLDKLVLHKGQVSAGYIEAGQRAELIVDEALRADTKRNHTATHLLHKALREIVGLHVRQAGSLVDPEKLRFDFNHFNPLSADEITRIEDLVNSQILANTQVETQVLPIEQAKQCGAIAFFGEKYGAEVRVVGVGEFSKEFCGGTHVDATGEIGSFKIVSERGLAAGVRRLVALTGPKAVARFQESERLLKEAQERFFLTREDFLGQLAKAADDRKALEARIEELKMQLAKGGGSDEQIEDLGAYKVILKQVAEVEGGQMRQLADELMGKIKDGVVLLGSEVGGKVQLVVKTSRADVHAGNLVGRMAEVVGGKGGGRPDMAMAGGKDTDKLAEALQHGLSLLRG